MNKTKLIGAIVLTLPILLLVACGSQKGASYAKTSGSGAAPTPTPPGGSGAGQTYFNSTVMPMFNSRCISCHNEPRFGGTAPLSIYTYSNMRALLTSGTGSLNNALINRMQGIISHTGGNTCFTGVAQTPCAEVIAWWNTENPGAPSGAGFIGGIDLINETGTVYGWAQNVNNPTAAVNVIFYDGPAGTGTLIGNVTANQVGPGGPGLNHYFTYDLPAAYRNGTNRTLYAYAASAIAANQLPASPKNYVAYTPRAAGQTYYTNTLRPMLVNRCAGCHSQTELDYQFKYYDLISPTPAAGGTALNNKLINKAAGMAHNGGNICGNKNTAPCSQIQQWWILEFQ